MAPRALQFERREFTGLTWFILVAGILASSIAWFAWRDHARDESRADLARSAGDLSQRVAGNVRRHDQVLLSAAGLFAASREVTRREFSDFARAIRVRRRLPDVRSIVWIRGRPGSVRAVYVTSRDGWASPGRGLNSVGGLERVLQEAADGDKSVLIRTYVERNGAPRDLAMVRPVYHGARTPKGLSDRRRSLVGWVALKMRADAFLTEDMRTFASHGRAVLLSPIGQPVSSTAPGIVSPVIRNDDLKREDRFDLEGEAWVLRTSRRAAPADSVDRAGPAITLVVGVALSLFLFVLLRFRLRAVRDARRRTRDLRDNEEQFRALATSSPVGICLLDEAEECRYVNQSWADIHGIDPEQAIGREALPTLDAPDRAAWDAAIERGRQGSTTKIECRVVRPEGGERWVVYHGAPLRHESGELRGWVVSAGDITDRRAYEVELKRRALHDELTGLPNRALLMEQLAHALAASRRQGRSTGVLFIDLDRLKAVNDAFGHPVGDEVIRTAARRLDQTVRPGDTVGRFAGDEFVVICEDVGDETDVLRVAERLVTDLGEPAQAGGQRLSVTASIGIAFGNSGDDPGEVLRDADSARHQAKLQGGGGVELFDTRLNIKAHQRLELENALRGAIDRDEFEVYYQPLVELPSRRAIGFEALLRWHRDGALVAPDDFIPAAEETGLILPIGRWVLNEACEQAARWNAESSNGPVSLSVNVSARQIVEPGLPETVAEALAATGLDPECLSLEITESVLLGPGGDTLATLERIQRLGVRLSLDDFGTGYSALSYLKRFPIEELKIDRAFVTDLARSAEDYELVAAIVAMAHALGFSVIAEGVETEEQLEALEDLTVKRAQGYLFSRPVRVAEATAMLADGGMVRPVAH
jgi:diguanylate cyclase (GGDEF)-like protein/PAS domain S-box-containing protein